MFQMATVVAAGLLLPWLGDTKRRKGRRKER
jgi:hypothetical protein